MSDTAQQETFGYEEDFQKAIVAAALKDPTFLLQYEDVLLPSYFDFDYLSSILRTARELAQRLGEVPTKMSVVEELKEYCERFNLSPDDTTFILNKVEDAYAANSYDLNYVQERVLKFGQRQALRTAILKIVTILNAKSKDQEADFEKARTILDKALNTGLGTRDMGLSVYPMLTQIPDLARRTSSGLDRKIATMIDTVDKKTWGGPGRGEVWVVVGLPGRGKSAFLINLGAAALKAGYPVVHFTVGDLNEVDVGVRYAARLTMCTTYEVITKSDAYMERATRMSQYNPHLHVKYWPSGTATMSHVRAYLSRLKLIEEVSPALVLIDYPEEFKRSHGDNLYLEGEDNYSQMNRIAGEFDCLVWAASQPKNWTAQHKHDVIKGQNMGESWRKFQKVDGMVSWNMDYEEEMSGRARLWVDKTRRNKSYYLVHMDVDMERMLIREGKPPQEDED